MRTPIFAAWLLLTGCGGANVLFLPDPQGDAGDAGSASEAGQDATPSPEAAPPTDAGTPEAEATVSGPPPCQGIDPTLVNNAITCAEQYCDTKAPDDPTGQLVQSPYDPDAGKDCLISNCAGQIVTVENSSELCYDCVINALEAEQAFDTVLTSCSQ
jgi:hypothetical protein